ncbi:MAG: class I SAM-dependent methyltransferase [Xanthobacteraceae bacterium]|jgi:SAM-dependent methyltransferase
MSDKNSPLRAPRREAAAPSADVPSADLPDAGTMRCPICAAAADVWADFNGIPILRCRQADCGFRFFDLAHWTSPYGAADYYQSWEPGPINFKAPWIEARVRLVQRFRSAGKVLDLGCGIGETAVALSDAGFDTSAVEESPKAIAYLRGKFPGVAWFNEDVAAYLRKNPGTFDVATMFHVLEHIPQPGTFMALVGGALRPNGLLVIEVPDAGGGFARLRGLKWEYYLHHHVNYFDTRSLRKLLGRFGYRLAFLQRTYHFSHPQGHLAKDIVKAALARSGLNAIIRTAWTR